MFSIILPTYNSEDTLSAVINSILNQSYIHWELIIWDDCSEDASVKIARVYSDKDKRISIGYNESNIGVGRTRNEALKSAKNPWICFIDSDDIWNKDKLDRTRIDINNNASFNCFYHDYIDYKTRKKVVGPAIVTLEHLQYYNPVGCFTVTINKNVLSNDPFEARRKRQDWQLWYRMSLAGEKFKKTPGILGEYGLSKDGQNISANKFEMLYINYKIFLSRGYGKFSSICMLLMFLKIQLFRRLR